jgi:hypothetical protein
MTPERRALDKAFARYRQAKDPTAALVHELLDATAKMVAADTERRVSFLVDGVSINRDPVRSPRANQA